MLILLLMLAVAVLVWIWTASLRAREKVLRACAAACASSGAQLLDQTVVLSRLGLRRDETGRLALWREYTFEFSTSGADRRAGLAVVVGDSLRYVRMDHPDGPTIIPLGASPRSPH